MDRQTGGEADWPGREALHDLAACLRFYSRLPVPQLPGEPDPHRSPDFTRLPRMLPLAGVILALPAALMLAAASLAGLGPFLAATLAVAVMATTTGGLHEDGLADLADGLGGGHDRAKILAIMRDSRVGSYGALVLFLALALRIGALATLLDRIGLGAATGFVLAAAVSRSRRWRRWRCCRRPGRTGSRLRSGGRERQPSAWPLRSASSSPWLPCRWACAPPAS